MLLRLRSRDVRMVFAHICVQVKTSEIIPPSSLKDVLLLLGERRDVAFHSGQRPEETSESGTVLWHPNIRGRDTSRMSAGDQIQAHILLFCSAVSWLFPSRVTQAGALSQCGRRHSTRCTDIYANVKCQFLFFPLLVLNHEAACCFPRG